MILSLEIHHSGRWQKAATFDVRDDSVAKGYNAASSLLYDDEYVAAHILATDYRALSCALPVSFELYTSKTWPAFLLDILPSGAARRLWRDELRLVDGPTSDMELLRRGAGNPPGNLRIKEAVIPLNHNESYLGFERDEVISKNENFISYAKSMGAPVAGSSGAPGHAPKWLLTQDKFEGNWHADGALQDQRALKHWIVKFPRGRRKSDRVVLRNEAAYMKVAAEFGLRVHEVPTYESDALFVPRFDRRITESGVVRDGMETLASLANISDFGVSTRHEVLLQALVKCVDDPDTEVFEYLQRDVLNLALKNTDNHARNTSILKKDDGSIALSPLYDFAPMFLDEDGIARVTTWSEERHLPDWAKVLESVDPLVRNPRALRERFRALADTLKHLPELMERAKCDSDIVTRLMKTIMSVEESIRGI